MNKLYNVVGFCSLAACVTVTSLASDSFSLNGENVDMQIEVSRYPIYPMALLKEGYSDAEVVIAFEVDHLGELRDWIVVRATHPGFVDAVANVIDTWDFTPPRIDGKSRSIVSRLKVKFRSSGSVLSFDLNSGMNTVRMNEIMGFRGANVGLSNVRDLDTSPKVTRYVNPEIPLDLMKEHNQTKAVFSFYVDEGGRVRVPALTRIDGDVDANMLLAAQDALVQWQFEPPTKKSKPVNVRLSQAFLFTSN